jgi:hypothetical protein
MLSNYLLPDILQYILNEYLDHHPEDIIKLEKIINLKFETNKYTTILEDATFTCKEIHIDSFLVKKELYMWDVDGDGEINKFISEESNYKNHVHHGKKLRYFKGKLEIEYDYVNGKLRKTTFYNKDDIKTYNS